MPCGRSLQVTGRADRVGAEHPCEAICASEWDTTGEPGSGGVLCATDVEVARAGAWCLVVPWVGVGANCTRVGWGTQRPQGGRLQRILRSPGAGLNMDPGEYSKRGLSELLSDLLWRVGIATDRCATAVSFSSSRSSGILIAFSIAGVGSYSGPSAMKWAHRYARDAAYRDLCLLEASELSPMPRRDRGGASG